jgi:Uma2 family endonuclease
MSRDGVSAAMTLAEWAALEDDVEGELVDGVLVDEETPTDVHELAVAWLLAELTRWVLPRGGYAFGSGRKLAVGRRRGRKADVSVHLPGAPPLDPHASLVTAPPGIVVEVISPRPRDIRRDRIAKSAEYARFGVAWYWLVDPAVRSLDVYELGRGGRYTLARSAGDGRRRIPGCRGLTLDLDALWKVLARLEAGGSSA